MNNNDLHQENIYRSKINLFIYIKEMRLSNYSFLSIINDLYQMNVFVLKRYFKPSKQLKFSFYKHPLSLMYKEYIVDHILSLVAIRAFEEQIANGEGQAF